MTEGIPAINRTCQIIRADGKNVPVSISTAILYGSDGQIMGGAETFRDLTVEENLKKELSGKIGLDDIISRSPLMQKVFDRVRMAAPTEGNILIEGETGSGKEILARSIHNLSPRRKKPFIAINCAALPENLLESELFGYKAGAFTGASKDKPGRIAAAAEGTLFLDEIGEMPLSFQSKILRFIQERTYEALGDNRTIHSDVRLIFATNRKLEDEVANGSFRQDLYYRINVIKLTLPPLRERREDIPLLTEHFIRKFNMRYNRDVKAFSRETLALLTSHDYRGNIRELENIVEHCFVLCRKDIIKPDCLPEYVINPAAGEQSTDSIKQAVHSCEAQLILAALSKHNYNRLAAAQELKIHKSTFFRKIKKLGIKVPSKSSNNATPT